MTRAWERRSERTVAIAAGHMTRSKFIIWCSQPEHMPATIDLLIAQGSLSESDRPRCVHWTVVRARGTTSQEEVAKTMDAEEMLSKAGIRTVTMETCEAPIREMGELEAWLRDRWSDYPEHLKWLDQVVGDSTADHEAAVKPRPED